MKKDRHFRAVMATCLCFLLAVLIWWRAEWSVVQIVCFVVMLLVGLALLINNQRSEAFHQAAGIPFIAAAVVYFWSDTQSLRGSIVLLPVTSYFAWLAMKSYYIKWKTSHCPADDSNKPLLDIEGNNKG